MGLKLISPDTWDCNSSFLCHYHSMISERDLSYFDNCRRFFIYLLHICSFVSRGHVCVEVREQHVGVGCLLWLCEFKLTDLEVRVLSFGGISLASES